MKYNLTITIIDYLYAIELIQSSIPIKAQIAVYTGMHRLGLDYKNITQIKELLHSNLDITGIYSHLCVADSDKPEDEKFTRKQIERFNNVINNLSCEHKNLKFHLQSSFGLLNYSDLKYDYVRVGINQDIERFFDLNIIKAGGCAV